MVNGSPLLNQMVITWGLQARGRPINCDSWPNPMTSNAIWTSTQVGFLQTLYTQNAWCTHQSLYQLQSCWEFGVERIHWGSGVYMFFLLPSSKRVHISSSKVRKKDEILLMELMEEILRAPVDMVNIPLFTRFFYIPGGAGFLPSTVCFQES